MLTKRINNPRNINNITLPLLSITKKEFPLKEEKKKRGCEKETKKKREFFFLDKKKEEGGGKGGRKEKRKEDRKRSVCYLIFLLGCKRETINSSTSTFKNHLLFLRIWE